VKKYVFVIVSLFLVAVCVAAVTTSMGINLTISGLGNNTISYSKSFSATEPDAVTQQYRVLDTNGTSEVVALGDVNAITGMVLACIDDSDPNTNGGLAVDCNYVSSFTEDFRILEGEAAYFKPSGIVRVVGPNSTESPIYEYVVFGTR